MQDWTISAVIMIALFAGFITLVFWAWSKDRKDAFEHASCLPLEEELTGSIASHKENKGQDND